MLSPSLEDSHECTVKACGVQHHVALMSQFHKLKIRPLRTRKGAVSYRSLQVKPGSVCVFQSPRSNRCESLSKCSVENSNNSASSIASI